MTQRSDVMFADRVDAMPTPGDQANRQLNAGLAKATQACGDVVFDGTVIRIELYHLKQAQAGSRMGWHRHPFTELTWVEGGPITYEQDEQSITLRDGDYFLMPPFIPHRWRTLSQSAALHGFMLTVMPKTERQDSLVPYLAAAAARLGHRLPSDRATAAALEQAEAQAIQGDALGIEAAAGYMRAGLAGLFRRIVEAIPADTASVQRTGPPAAVERAAAFIASHLAEPIDVAAIASHVRLSTRQLDRLFHEAFDMPTGAYLLHTRLERARYLLSDSDLSIKQIARACGFAEPNYFSRIFRKRHGQSPGAYRRQTKH
jgi:AraC family L-rhamnose operon regulatory protein RhaS